MTRDEKTQAAHRLHASGLCDREIAPLLGYGTGSGSCVWKLRNPKAASAAFARSNAKRAALKREWENEHDRGICPCGAVTGVGANRRGTRHCASCAREIERVERAMRMQPLYEMWHEGRSMRAMGLALGMAVGTVGYHVCTMRAEGWDMPYRRVPSGRGTA